VKSRPAPAQPARPLTAPSPAGPLRPARVPPMSFRLLAMGRPGRFRRAERVWPPRGQPPPELLLPEPPQPEQAPFWERRQRGLVPGQTWAQRIQPLGPRLPGLLRPETGMREPPTWGQLSRPPVWPLLVVRRQARPAESLLWPEPVEWPSAWRVWMPRRWKTQLSKAVYPARSSFVPKPRGRPPAEGCHRPGQKVNRRIRQPRTGL